MLDCLIERGNANFVPTCLIILQVDMDEFVHGRDLRVMEIYFFEIGKGGIILQG